MTSLANFQFGDALRKGLGLGAGDVSPQMGTRALDVVRASSADELAAALAELEQRAKTGRGLIGGITGAGLTGAGMIGYPFGED
jgi:hypothetical protein